MDRRILIAGCGYVGCALGRYLAQSGRAVWGLRRSVTGLPESIRPVAADLCEPESLKRLPEDLTGVFYTAGAAEFRDDAYRAAYVTGLANLLDALRNQRQKPSRIIFTSSTGVYEQSDGEWVDESSPTEPSSFSGQRVLEGERLLEASDFPSVILRLGGIYGPGRTRLIDRVRSGEARRERNGPRYLNLIHLADIVGALAHLMMLPDPGRVYIGVDSEPQVWNDLVDYLAKQLDVPPPPFSDDHQTRGRPFRNRRCSNARLRETGYVFRYPSARQGYGELIDNAKI